MQKKEILKKKLEEKVNTEFKNYIENLKKYSPEEIIERAYEKVSKEEMIYKITDKEYSIIELKALLKTDELLEEFYDEWLKSDGNFNEVLEFAVDNRVDIITEEFRERYKKDMER